MNSNEAHRRAEALFKKEQQLREAEKAMGEYQAELHAMRERTARLRVLRLARDANQRLALPADHKGATQLVKSVRRKNRRPRSIRTRDEEHTHSTGHHINVLAVATSRRPD